MRKADGKESQIQACIDGEIPQGSLGIAIDDVATDGASKIEVATRIRECGCGFNIDRFVIMVDRGGVSELQEKGYDIRAMYNLGELMGIYLEKQIISPDQHAKILGYDAYMKQYKASHPQLVTAP
jgi:orotate phosphoribosyltransferase